MINKFSGHNPRPKFGKLNKKFLEGEISKLTSNFSESQYLF